MYLLRSDLTCLFIMKNIATDIKRIGIRVLKISSDNLLTIKVPNDEPMNDNTKYLFLFTSVKYPFKK